MGLLFVGWHAAATGARTGARILASRRVPTSKRGWTRAPPAVPSYGRMRDGRRPGRGRAPDPAASRRRSPPPRPGLLGRLLRQGPLPARQDVWRRARRPRRCACSSARASPRRRSRLPATSRCARRVLVSPSGRRVHLPLPDRRRPRRRRRPGAVSTPRSSPLRARRGVDVREGDGVDELVVACRRGRRCARATATTLERAPPRRGRRPLVDGATRCSSPTRRVISARGTRSRQYFDRRRRRAAVGRCSNDDLLPGYAWVFPLPGGGANVGYGVSARTDARAATSRRCGPSCSRDRCCARSSARTRSRAEPVRAWPIPTAYDPHRLTDGPRALRRRRRRRRRPDDRRRHRAGARDRHAAADAIAAVAAPKPSRSGTARTSIATLGRDLRFAARLAEAPALPRGARAAIRRPS